MFCFSSHPLSTVAVEDPPMKAPAVAKHPALVQADGVMGRWKHGLCEACCNVCCQGLWWNAWCFPCIPWAQILTRMKLDYFANRTEAYKNTFAIVVGLYILYEVLSRTSYVTWSCEKSSSSGYSYYDDDDYSYHYSYSACSPSGITYVFWAITWPLGIYFLFLMTKARNRYRRRYQIDGSCCGDSCLDDCCCMFWCGCCSSVQMLRHTHHESEYRYQCCNKTGLPDFAPEIV